MPTTPATTQFGTAGWLMLLALGVGVTTRLLKADKLNALLAQYSIPAIPKTAIPWIALALGAGGGFLEAFTGGHSLQESLIMSFWGIVSGGVAVAGHEALEQPVRTVLGHKAGNVAFGKKTVCPVPEIEVDEEIPPVSTESPKN